jgi:hypothetical protein
MMHVKLGLLLLAGTLVMDAATSKSFAATEDSRTKASSLRGLCWALSQDLKAGEPISLAQVVDVPCRGATGNKFPQTARLVGYDRRNGQLVMRQDAVAGAYLGPVALSQQASLQPQSLGSLFARVGAVEVSRTVEVLQAGSGGGKIFVSLPEGEVISVQVLPEASSLGVRQESRVKQP